MKRLGLFLLALVALVAYGCSSDAPSTEPVGDTTPTADGGPKQPGAGGTTGGAPGMAPEPKPGPG